MLPRLQCLLMPFQPDVLIPEYAFFFCLWVFPGHWNLLFPPSCQIGTTRELMTTRSRPQLPTTFLGWHISEECINSPQGDNNYLAVVVLGSVMHPFLSAFATSYHCPAPYQCLLRCPNNLHLKPCFRGCI